MSLILSCLLFITLTNTMEILQPDTVVRFTNGTTAIIKCPLQSPIDHKEIDKIDWLRHERQILTRGSRRITKDVRFSLSNDGFPKINSINLILNPILESDLGKYVCRYKNANASYSVVREVTIKVDIPPYGIENAQNSLRVEEKDSINISCRIRGVPKPVITFYFTKNPSAPRDRVKIQDYLEYLNMTKGRGYLLRDDDIENGQLYIHKVTKELHGYIVCIGDNRVGQPYQQVIQLNVLYTPKVKMLNKNLRQGLKKQTMLICEVDSYPKRKPIWFKFDKARAKKWVEITNETCNDSSPSTRFCILNYEEFCMKRGDNICQSRLHINHLEREDFTDYMCSVETLNRGRISDLSTLIEDRAEGTWFEQFRNSSERKNNKRKPTQSLIIKKSSGPLDFFGSSTTRLQSSCVVIMTLNFFILVHLVV